MTSLFLFLECWLLFFLAFVKLIFYFFLLLALIFGAMLLWPHGVSSLSVTTRKCVVDVASGLWSVL